MYYLIIIELVMCHPLSQNVKPKFFFLLLEMEINDANLAELLGHLQKTLSPDGATRKSGEISITFLTM